MTLDTENLRHSPPPWRIERSGDFLDLSTSDRNNAHIGRIIVKEAWFPESVAAKLHLNFELARRAPELYASLARVSAALKGYMNADHWWPEAIAAVREADALLDLKPPTCLTPTNPGSTENHDPNQRDVQPGTRG